MGGDFNVPHWAAEKRERRELEAGRGEDLGSAKENELGEEAHKESDPQARRARGQLRRALTMATKKIVPQQKGGPIETKVNYKGENET